MPKTTELKKIKEEIIELKSSPLYDYRNKNKYFPVIGEGNHDAKIVFVGEAPGLNEAKTGRSFVGDAGKVLDQLLEGININRKDVYITNVVKDRPPANRDPNPNELELYGPYLLRQLKIIKPKIIATLGRFSMTYVMENFGLKSHLTSISKIHGKVFKAETSAANSIFIIPLYHPAVAIYNPGMLKVLQDDFAKIKELVAQKD